MRSCCNLIDQYEKVY